MIAAQRPQLASYGVAVVATALALLPRPERAAALYARRDRDYVGRPRMSLPKWGQMSFCPRATAARNCLPLIQALFTIPLAESAVAGGREVLYRSIVATAFHCQQPMDRLSSTKALR